MLQSGRQGRGCVSVFPGRGRVGSWEGGALPSVAVPARLCWRVQVHTVKCAFSLCGPRFRLGHRRAEHWAALPVERWGLLVRAPAEQSAGWPGANRHHRGLFERARALNPLADRESACLQRPPAPHRAKARRPLPRHTG